ncbi:MAG: glycosyltransferase [Proteobacteria bacterium]|nr:glycosyltransferase [Pseudomonadota bacterium]
MKKTHLMYLLSSLEIGGAEIDVLNLTKEMLRKGYQITIASKGGVLEQKLPAEVNCLYVDLTNRHFLIALWTKLKILAYCFFNSVEVLNPQSVRGVMQSAVASKILGIPLLATIHNLQNPNNIKRAVRILNYLSVVTLFVSKYERQKFIDAGLNPLSSNVTYSGIDVRRFSSVGKQTDKKPIIGIIGRLSPEKGIPYGIKAFHKIHMLVPLAKLRIIGDGPEMDRLKRLVTRLGIGDKVEFSGARNDIPEQLKKIDLVLLPSLNESLSVSAREAMASGKTVIASDVGGMSELIEHEVNGILVNSGGVEELAAMIKKCLQSPEWMASMGSAAREKISAQFSMKNWSNKMDRIYQRSMGNPMTPQKGQKRKILYLTPRFPYPTIKGDTLRAFHQIQEMSKYNDIYLASLQDTDHESSELSCLEPYCFDIMTFNASPNVSEVLRFLAHFSWIPSQIAYFHNRKLQANLNKIVLSRDIDTVYCQIIRTGQYAKSLKNVWKVIDFVDALSLNLKRNLENSSWYQKVCLWVRMMKVAVYEQRMMKSFDQRIIISKVDRDHLQSSWLGKLMNLKSDRSRKENSMLVIPNGVIHGSIKTSGDSGFKISKENSIVFTGNMDYGPNEDAARYLVEEILPLLDPEINLFLIGNNTNQSVKKLASDRVVVTGRVPSMIGTIREAALAVCPMRLGAGQQNKVLEAMSAGVPVVATSIANAGIEAKNCAVIKDAPKEIAESINFLIRNPQECRLLRDKAYRFINHKFDWSKIMKTMQIELWHIDEIPQSVVSDQFASEMSLIADTSVPN